MKRSTQLGTLACLTLLLMTCTTASAALITSGSGSSNASSPTASPGVSGFLTTFTVSSATTVNRIDQLTHNSGSQNTKFVIFNSSTQALLFSTAAQVFGADAGTASFANATYKQSAPLSFTFNPGTLYAVGAISQNSGMRLFGDTSQPDTTVGAFTFQTAPGPANQNVTGFLTPVLQSATNCCDTNIRLNTDDGTDVPEPTSLLIYALGLVCIGGYARRKRNKADA